jgi:beta-glucanase (GH16 family)
MAEPKRIAAALWMFLILAGTGFSKNYKGAELRTKVSYLYGRFEVRYKASWGSGQTSTFFTYNDDYPSTPWNEIDIEILGRYRDDVQFNAITPQRINHVRHQFVGFDPYTDFHTYAFEWTPGYVAWFIDGEEVARQTQEHIQTLQHPQKIMMNIWNPDAPGWAGPFDDRMLPFFAYYDYVSYASYTPGLGDTGTDNEFTLQWTDHFDSWDTSRWEKATHTFPGNKCDFISENCVFQNGQMILCLTDNDDLGYTDHRAPSVLWARADVGGMVTVQFSEAVEQTSAENLSNYSVAGMTILQAHLLSNRTRVELTVTGIDLSTAFNLVVLGIEDVAETPNKLIGQVIPVIMPDPLELPVQINVGGNASGFFLPDQAWNEEAEYGYSDGWPGETSPLQAISGTDNDVIYQTDRRGLVSYRIRLPNGEYQVTLMLADNTDVNAGQRVFDIFIEGEEAVHHLDIIQEKGKNAACDIVLNEVDVTDSRLDIHFCAVSGEPLLNGIYIDQLIQGVGDGKAGDMDSFLLIGNYPNPFNSSTVIRYFLPEGGNVRLTVYDTSGRVVERIVDGYQGPGEREVLWQGVPSGVYFYTVSFSAGGIQSSHTGKMVLLK